MGERPGSQRSSFESASFKVAERDYRILIDSIRDYAIFMLGPDGRIETWNSGAEALHGYSSDEAVGERLAMLSIDDDRAAGKPARRLAMAQAVGRAEDEGWRARKDGSRFWASSVLTALWDGSRLLGFAEVTRDLTARRRADVARAEALARTEALLAEAQKVETVGRVSAAIAHEFNNVLSVILMYCDLLANDLGPAQGPLADVQEIEKAASRAARLTQQLLQYTRRRTVARHPVDLSEVVTGIEGMLRRPLGPAIELVLELTRPLPVVMADRLSLEQTLLILTSNACDAMPGGGTLTIRTCVERGEGGAESSVVIAVADTGIGMDEATQARCFDPFFSTKGASDRAGMGLAIALANVRQSGGVLRMKSVPGKGTTMRIAIPHAAI
jgi:PAS domain S-box-containing protein